MTEQCLYAESGESHDVSQHLKDDIDSMVLLYAHHKMGILCYMALSICLPKDTISM